MTRPVPEFPISATRPSVVRLGALTLRSRYVLAGLYRRRDEPGDDDRAREELTRALRQFEEMRAVRDIARARSALAGAEVRLP